MVSGLVGPSDESYSGSDQSSETESHLLRLVLPVQPGPWVHLGLHRVTRFWLLGSLHCDCVPHIEDLSCSLSSLWFSAHQYAIILRQVFIARQKSNLFGWETGYDSSHVLTLNLTYLSSFILKLIEQLCIQAHSFLCASKTSDIL